jgi:hypothetical protein
LVNDVGTSWSKVPLARISRLPLEQSCRLGEEIDDLFVVESGEGLPRQEKRNGD